MQKIVLLILFAFLGSSLFAQKAFENKFKFDKKINPVVNGVGLKVEQEPEVVQQVIEKKFYDAAKAKSKKVRKGIIVFEKVVLPEISSASMDYYFKFDEVSKDKYMVEMFLSLGNNNFISSAKFPNEMEAAKRFMDNLVRESEMRKMMLLIQQQEAKIQEQEKEIAKVVKGKEELSKEHQKLVEEIKKNEANQTKMVEEEKNMTLNLDGMVKELQRLKAELDKIR